MEEKSHKIEVQQKEKSLFSVFLRKIIKDDKCSERGDWCILVMLAGSTYVGKQNIIRCKIKYIVLNSSMVYYVRPGIPCSKK